MPAILLIPAGGTPAVLPCYCRRPSAGYHIGYVIAINLGLRGMASRERNRNGRGVLVVNTWGTGGWLVGKVGRKLWAGSKGPPGARGHRRGEFLTFFLFKKIKKKNKKKIKNFHSSELLTLASGYIA